MRRIFFIIAATFSLMSVAVRADDNAKMEFWTSGPRKGANFAPVKFRPEYYASAAKHGIEFFRFHPDKYQADERDFLIGDADEFQGVNETDFKLLVRSLDEANKHGLKVILTMRSLPGSRWKQHNNDKFDYRLWNDEKYHEQCAAFWREIARRLKGHPAIVGYNPLNEPCPARQKGIGEHGEAFEAWLLEKQGTAGDLQRFNQRMVDAIREVDSQTPIMLDFWFFADADSFRYIKPISDPFILYPFHFLGPWEYTTLRVNNGRYEYPDKMPGGWQQPPEAWPRDRLAKRLSPVIEFCKRHDIPMSRIVASEFWCDRRIVGAAEYMEDCIKAYNAVGVHWAFYSYRSDEDWGGLDYELGTSPGLGPAYWAAKEAGQDAEPLKKRSSNPLWNVISRELKSTSAKSGR